MLFMEIICRYIIFQSLIYNTTYSDILNIPIAYFNFNKIVDMLFLFKVDESHILMPLYLLFLLKNIFCFPLNDNYEKTLELYSSNNSIKKHFVHYFNVSEIVANIQMFTNITVHNLLKHDKKESNKRIKTMEDTEQRVPEIQDLDRVD